MATLKEQYKTQIVPQLKTELGLKNVMQVPRLQKIVLNMGVGEATQNQRILEDAVTTLSTVTGQKAVVTRAKKSDFEF